VALPAEKMRDRVNREIIFFAAGVLSATPLTYCMRRDHSDVVVFCFAEPEDAEAFAERFGGKRFVTGSLKTKGATRRIHRRVAVRSSPRAIPPRRGGLYQALW
jgi:hypothetical protein